jgi:NADPH2:quinone reductase
MKAVRVHKPGGVEGMVYEDVPDPKPGAGQALVQIEAIGLNFAEVGRRRNANPADLPAPIGGEGAGTIVQVGEGVTEFRPGDRVAFNGVQGAYAEMIAAPVARLVRVPETVTSKQAAATLLQGMTAHYLACSTYPLAPGDTCVVHAAAGGVGLLLCQIAKQRGARVIGTVSTEEKAKAARAAGADDVILYSQVDFAEETKRLTNGRGVDVIYDSVGKDTFMKGLDCIRPRGMMVGYGAASGPIEPFDTSILGQKGCLFLTRVNLGTYTATREELEQRSGDVFGWVGSGQLKVHIFGEFPLSEAGKAQSALEHRETIGKVLLIP